MRFLVCLLILLNISSCVGRSGNSSFDRVAGQVADTREMPGRDSSFDKVAGRAADTREIPGRDSSFDRVAGRVSSSKDLPTGELALEIARCLIGTPYVAGTLEHEPETLRVSMDSTDCILFVELCCSFARMIKTGQPSRDRLEDEVRQMRYRNGVVDGYTSRIHYTSEWLQSNASRGVLDEVTRTSGGIPLDQSFSFMSEHPDSYLQLKDNPGNIARIKEMEARLNEHDYFYIPQSRIDSADIRNGDIICFISKVKGLDISHVALACEVDGKMHFIHASSRAGKVVVDDRTISEYATNGIRLARLR